MLIFHESSYCCPRKRHYMPKNYGDADSEWISKKFKVPNISVGSLRFWASKRTWLHSGSHHSGWLEICSAAITTSNFGSFIFYLKWNELMVEFIKDKSNNYIMCRWIFAIVHRFRYMAEVIFGKKNSPFH